MKSASTQTEALRLKDKVKGFRSKFRKGGGCIPQTTSNIGAPDVSSSSNKKVQRFPKLFTRGTKQQQQHHQQQNGGVTKTNSPSATQAAAPKDEMRQEPDVIERDDVQATKMEDEKLLTETRIPAEETEQEKILLEDLKEEGKIATVEETIGSSNNNDDKAEEAVKEHAESKNDELQPEEQQDAVDVKVEDAVKEHKESKDGEHQSEQQHEAVNDKMEDAVKEHTESKDDEHQSEQQQEAVGDKMEDAVKELAESKDDEHQPEQQQEAVGDKMEDAVKELPESKDGEHQPEHQHEAVDEVNKVPSKEPNTNIVENAMNAMETAVRAFTEHLETAISSLSSHKGGVNEHQDKKVSESPQESQEEEVADSVPLDKQTSIKSKTNYHQEPTGTGNSHMRPPLMPPTLQKLTTKANTSKGGSKGNALKNLKSSVLRSNKEEQGAVATSHESSKEGGPDSVKSWPLTRKKRTLVRFRKVKKRTSRQKPSPSAPPAQLSATKPEVIEKSLLGSSSGNEHNNKEEDEHDEDGSSKGESSTLDTPNTMKGQEPTSTGGKQDATDDIPTSVDVMLSSRDEIEATIIPDMFLLDHFVVNRKHSHSSRCSQKGEKEETSPKNDVNDLEEVQRTHSHSSHVSKNEEEEGKASPKNDVTAVRSMGGAIESVMNVFMRALANPPKKINVDPSKINKEDNSEVTVPPESQTPEEKKGDAAPYQEQGNSDAVAAASSSAKEKALPKSDSQKDMEETTDDPASDSKKNEIPASVVADQPATSEQDQGEAEGEEMTENEITTTDKDTQNMGNESSSPIITINDETPKSDDNNRSSPLMPENQQAVASMTRKLSSSSTVQEPIEVEHLNGDEDEIPIQPVRIFPSVSSADNREQRQEANEEIAGDESPCEHKETSNGSTGVDSNIDNAPVMRSELLEGNVNFGRSGSNISSISADKNAKVVAGVIAQKTQKEENGQDEGRESPVSDEHPMDEVIIDGTRKFTDTYAMVNREREAQALSELRRSTYLDSLATSHAIVMAELLTLGHSVDSLSALQDQLRSDDVGENIQRGKDEREMHKLAMEPGTSSRYNILRPTYKQYGMGTAVGEDGMVYMVQLFRGPVKEDVHKVERVDSSPVWCSSLWC